MSESAERQVQLPFRKALQIAWKNIRVRWWRSMLVTSGIILALAFLTYVLSSDALAQSIAGRLPAELAASRQKVDADVGALRHELTSGAPKDLLSVKALLDSGEQSRAMLVQLNETLASVPEQSGALEQLLDSNRESLSHFVRVSALHEKLQKQGYLEALNDEDARAQTYWIVGLALLVSFVGILNAMLMSVTERFAEIGTMKCLGAMDSFVIKLFMLESTFQGISGALLGVLIGLLLAVVEGLLSIEASGLVAGMMPGLSFLKIVGGCMVAGTILTIIAALYPAWRAAKMQPVEAMRAEV